MTDKRVSYMVHPLGRILIHERTEPFSLRLRNWAKDVEFDGAAPFRGMDDCVWYARKSEKSVTIWRTFWHWAGGQEAVDSFDQILACGSTYVTSIDL